jgi:membrane protein implicated in regulation of membrane protease activity
MSRTVLCIKTIAIWFVCTAALTYLSLLVPGHVEAVCGNLGTPIYCSVLAYGFPLPFLADSQAISPVGSVARDPLSIAIGLDDLLWPRLTLAFLFWMLVVAISASGWRRWRRRRQSATSTSA